MTKRAVSQTERCIRALQKIPMLWFEAFELIGPMGSSPEETRRFRVQLRNAANAAMEIIDFEERLEKLTLPEDRI